MITIEASVLRFMIDGCSKCVSKGNERPKLKLIEIKVNDNEMEFRSINGYQIQQLKVNVNNSGIKNKAFLIEPFKIPSKQTNVEIFDCETFLQFKFYPSEISINVKTNYDVVFFNIDECESNNKHVENAVFALKKKYIMNALKSYNDEDVIKFSFNETLKPIILTSKGEIDKKSTILPVRMAGE